MRPKPFIKWAGGKQGLCSSLIGHFPRSYNRLFEPFIGGGSVFFALVPDKAIVGDLNFWLVDTYEAIRDDWQGVASELDRLPNTKDDFLRIRKINPESLSLIERAAQFIYLNKTCFRGLFRVNQRNEFNVPYGDYKRRYYEAANLSAASTALQNTEIRRHDFELCLHDVGDGDFVYLDPPYYKLGGYSDFNRYTRFQFRENDHIRLASICRELDQRGVKWAVSNSNTKFVRTLFNGFCVHEISNRREINLKSQERDIVELLITNYQIPQRDLFCVNQENEKADQEA